MHKQLYERMRLCFALALLDLTAIARCVMMVMVAAVAAAMTAAIVCQLEEAERRHGKKEAPPTHGGC